MNIINAGIPNNSPVVAKSIPDQSTTTYADYTSTISSGTFTDVDGDNLALTTSQNSGSSLPSWLDFTSTTWKFGGKPTTSDIGSYATKVVVSDRIAGSCSTTFTNTMSSYSCDCNYTDCSYCDSVNHRCNYRNNPDYQEEKA